MKTDSPVVHVCCKCGHQWQSVDKHTERKVIQAIKVNKDGPYCSLCQCFTMAGRYAEARGMQLDMAFDQFVKLK